MTTLHADLFWSFRSPYSYLATARLVGIARRYDVEFRARPVLPIAVRIPDFFDTVNPLWPPYVLRDTHRLAEFLGIPFAWPQPDPIVQELGENGRLRTAPEQPYIFRLNYLGVLASERGRGLALLDEVSRLIWSGETPGWNDGDHLADAVRRAGLDLAELDREAGKQTGRLDEVLEQNRLDLESAGHWGVPTVVFDGEPFFGQDRLDLLLWRLKGRGLGER